MTLTMINDGRLRRGSTFLSLRCVTMKDWNVVVTVYDERGYREAKSILARFGKVASTDFYNVLALKVADVQLFTEAIDALVQESPGVMNDISRIVPSHVTFNFQTPSEFEEKAQAVAAEWTDQLRGCAFYVRLHRRGFKGRISTPEEERFLDEVLLAKLESLGRPGRISFEDPDKIIDIETIGNRAGLSIWSRDELKRYSFLHID